MNSKNTPCRTCRHPIAPIDRAKVCEICRQRCHERCGCKCRTCGRWLCLHGYIYHDCTECTESDEEPGPAVDPAPDPTPQPRPSGARASRFRANLGRFVMGLAMMVDDQGEASDVARRRSETPTTSSSGSSAGRWGFWPVTIAVVIGLASLGVLSLGKRIWNAWKWCGRCRAAKPAADSGSRDIATQSQCTYTRKDSQPRFKPLPEAAMMGQDYTVRRRSERDLSMKF